MILSDAEINTVATDVVLGHLARLKFGAVYRDRALEDICDDDTVLAVHARALSILEGLATLLQEGLA